MNKKNFTRLLILLVLGVGMVGKSVAQDNPLPDDSKWGQYYGNEWIKFNQIYRKVTVTQEGVQRVLIKDLPEIFQDVANRAKIQIWHRGKQISIIKVDGAEVDINSAEILFYGVRNDGKSDELLYRPGASARTNTYVSLYSEISSYYLTVGSVDGLRSDAPSQSSISDASPLESYHLATELKVLQDWSSNDPNDAGAKQALMNSFFEEGRSLSGQRLSSGGGGALRIANSTNYTSPPDNLRFRLPLVNRSTASGIAPKINLAVAGRYESKVGNRTIKVYIVNTTGGVIRTLPDGTIPPFNNFVLKKTEFNLEEGDIINGNVNLGFSTSLVSGSERFSVSYYMVTYPQTVDMQGLTSFKFDFPAATQTGSRVEISGFPGNNASSVKLYDVTDTEKPRIINADASNFKLPRIVGSGLKLMATSAPISPVVSEVTFTSFSKSPDYLIVSTDALAVHTGTASGADTYAEYRATTLSPKGTTYKPLVVKISDLYDQFNYGEPSPVAIRHFVDYMLSGADKNKFLLLIGKANTYDRDLKNADGVIVKELGDQVPAIGYPGSDELLVDGLGGTRENVPGIPYGRIPANTAEQLTTYLEKVKEYELGKVNSNFAWRNRVVHVNGGNSNSQSSNFRNFLTGLSTSYLASGYDVFRYVKGTSTVNSSQEPTGVTEGGIQGFTIDQIKSTPETGVGIITFYGHGTTYQTDMNISYITDVNKAYPASNKYSGMFFFGCDVNNVFGNKTRLVTPYNGTSAPFTMDWLFASGKGAVTVFGNSWDGYSEPFEPYMNDLYARLFVPDAQKKPIGVVIKEVAQAQAPSAHFDDYSVFGTNIHQQVLLGDPAIKLLFSAPVTQLPVKLSSFTAKVTNNNSVDLKWTTEWEKNNSHFVIERSEDARTFLAIGSVEGKGTIDLTSTYNFNDPNPLPGKNYYRLLQVDAELVEGQTPLKSSYSIIVTASLPDSDLMVVSPNPTVSDVVLDVDSRVDVKSWNLIDGNGRRLRNNGKGKNISLTGYPQGTYILEIVTGNKKVYRKKIVKQ